MKKTVLTLAVALGMSGAFAQTTTTTTVTTPAPEGSPILSKKGERFLPEAGDWGIVVSANPFLEYIGDFFSTTGGSSPMNTWADDMVVTGKYFATEKMAYRAKLRLGFGSAKDETIVPHSTTANTFVTDETKYSYSNITIGAGMEWRRGKTRLQGFYGGEALINFGRGNDDNALEAGKTEMTYGEALSATNQNGGSSRTLEVKNGSTIGITIRGFVGAEYFIFPKMSLGLEYGWGLGFSKTGEGERTEERWDAAATTPAVVKTTTKTGGSSSFGIDTDNSGGMITLGFHF